MVEGLMEGGTRLGRVVVAGEEKLWSRERRSGG